MDPTGGHLQKFLAEIVLVEVRAGQAQRQQIARLGLTRQLPCSLQCAQQSRTQVAKIRSDEFHATAVTSPSRRWPAVSGDATVGAPGASRLTRH